LIISANRLDRTFRIVKLIAVQIVQREKAKGGIKKNAGDTAFFQVLNST